MATFLAHLNSLKIGLAGAYLLVWGYLGLWYSDWQQDVNRKYSTRMKIRIAGLIWLAAGIILALRFL